MISYLQVENLSKYWGESPLFDGISFSVSEGQKVAMIAKNGAGKSTLMDIIAGLETPDSGKSTLSNDISIGYLRQNPDLNPEDTVLEAAFNSSGELMQAVKNYEKALESHDPNLLDSATERMNVLNAWDFELRIKQILTQLKITDVNQQIKFLSGGQKKRVALAHILIDEPDFLILDEPTNDLDVFTLTLLEDFLLSFPGCLIIVSHDRYFMDKLVEHVFVFEGNGVIKDYYGNYSEYYREKLAEEQDLKSKQKQEKDSKLEPRVKEQSKKPTFKQQKEYEALTAEIEKMEAEKGEVLEKMNSGSSSTDELNILSIRYVELEKLLEEKENKWLELAELF